MWSPTQFICNLRSIERLFAEGFIYRQAANHPRKLIVVLGIWLIFGMVALAGLFIIVISRDAGSGSAIAGVCFGGIMLLISLVMIWKSTRNYLARKKVDEKIDT